MRSTRSLQLTTRRRARFQRAKIEPGMSGTLETCPTWKFPASRGRRRGYMLLAAMICLLLVSLVSTSLLRTALLQYKQVRNQELEAQALWLAEAGIERAAARLARDPNYAGETWQITLSPADKPMPASVTIAVVAKTATQPAQHVTVVAVYPTDRAQRAQVTKTVTVARPPTKKES